MIFGYDSGNVQLLTCFKAHEEENEWICCLKFSDWFDTNDGEKGIFN